MLEDICENWKCRGHASTRCSSLESLESSSIEIPEPEMINPVAGYWKQHVAKALSLTLKK
jgi:hypothetical protein